MFSSYPISQMKKWRLRVIRQLYQCKVSGEAEFEPRPSDSTTCEIINHE